MISYLKVLHGLIWLLFSDRGLLEKPGVYVLRLIVEENKDSSCSWEKGLGAYSAGVDILRKAGRIGCMLFLVGLFLF